MIDNILQTDALSAQECELMAHDEGVRYFVYDDATGRPIVKGSYVQGNPTIGIGRNLAAEGLTAQEISALLADDWPKCIAAANMYPWFAKLDKVRAYVVCNMIFNLGPGGFAQFKTFQSFLDRGLWTGAANSMLGTLWAKQVPNRAKELEAMMLTGELPNVGTAPSGH